MRNERYGGSLKMEAKLVQVLKKVSGNGVL
jgi:hypothetical protein